MIKNVVKVNHERSVEAHALHMLHVWPRGPLQSLIPLVGLWPIIGAQASAAAKRPGLCSRRLSSLKSADSCGGVVRASQSCFDASDLARVA